MKGLADFAAVAQVRGTVIQDLLSIYHRSGLLPVSEARPVTLAVPVMGQVTGNLDLFLDCPVITLAPNPAQRLSVAATGVATVTVTAAGVEQRAQARITVSASATPTAVVLEDGVQVTVTADALTFDEVSVAVLFSPLPELDETLESEEVSDAIADLLRTMFGATPSITQPLFAGLPQLIDLNRPLEIPGDPQVRFPVTIPRIEFVVLSGVLCVAIDLLVQIFVPQSSENGLETTGDPAKVESFLGTADVATALAAATINFGLRKQLQPVQAATNFPVDEEGNPLPAPGFQVRELTAHIETDRVMFLARVEAEGFIATLRAQVKVWLGTKGGFVETYDDEYGGQYTVVTPGTRDLWIDIEKVDISVSEPLWVAAAAALGFVVGTALLGPGMPIFLVAMVGFIDDLIGNLEHDVAAVGQEVIGQSLPEELTSTRRVTLPGTTGPFVDLQLAEFKVHGDGMRTSIFLKTQWDDNLVERIHHWDPKSGQMVSIEYSANQLPHHWHPADPSVFVRWQSRHVSSGVAVSLPSTTGPWADPSSRSYEVNVGAYYDGTVVTSCRIFRQMTRTTTTELMNVSLSSSVEDSVDRSRPYVHWEHDVFFPIRETLPSGQVREGKVVSEHRRSAIHRTAVPGRCRSVAQHYDGTLQYLDELPFPMVDLAEHRHLVCDFCFYGGPDKDVPLV